MIHDDTDLTHEKIQEAMWSEAERLAKAGSQVARIIEASAVAYWNEPTQMYFCRPCRKASLMRTWQAVCEEAANAIARDLGKTHCDRCDKPIGHEATR
jgi:hypothetical protein